VPETSKQGTTVDRKLMTGATMFSGILAPEVALPRECERLQGFPDGYTLVIHNGKPAADSPRYKALGNSMAVPVIRWIGLRIIDGAIPQGRTKIVERAIERESTKLKKRAITRERTNV
jgi:site-specific DNA-cytosine methylase